MSRSNCSYDEEWPRKKSPFPKRSLFHDIPTLPPLEEEFDSSTQVDFAPTDEVFPSPPRPYRPLPPLIIERVPEINKHDEPEEFYQKLHKKMKRIYVELFIENRDVNSVDFDSNDDDGLVSNDHLTIHDNSDTTENLDIPFHQSISLENENLNSIVEDRDDSQSSDDTASIDVINYSRSNEDAIMISEEERLASEKLDEKKISNDDNVNKRTREQNKFSTERIEDLTSAKERNVGNTTIYDQEMIESGESLHEMEVEHSYEVTGPNYKRIDESMKQTHHTSIREQKSTHIEDFNESGNEKQTEDLTETDLDSYDSGSELEPSSTSEDPDYRQVTVKAMVHIDGSQGNEDRESDEESVRSIILPARFKMVPSRKVDERIGGLAALEEKEDPDYRQVTVKAMVHIDGSQGNEDRESDEESVRSIILPARFKMVPSRKVDERIGGLAALEEKEDPDYRQVTVKAMVHIDGSQGNEDPESDEESVRSIILPARFKMVPSRKVDERIGGLAALEEKKDPNTAPIFDSDQEETTDEDLEEETTQEQARSRSEQGSPCSIASGIWDWDSSSEGSSTSQFAISEETKGTARAEQEIDNSVKAVDERRYQTDFTEKDLVDVETYQSDATSTEIQTHQQYDSGIMIEEVATHQLATPEIAEEIITDQPEAANEETGTHQPVINMDEDGEAPNEDMESPHPIEVMRTPRPDLSHRIPIRHESSSRSAGELAAVPRHTTAIMSSSQDEVGSNVSEIQTCKIEASGRKRKLIDKSVQTVLTSMVSWDEMRSNFSVGTPKIFRLCD